MDKSCGSKKGYGKKMPPALKERFTKKAASKSAPKAAAKAAPKSASKSPPKATKASRKAPL